MGFLDFIFNYRKKKIKRYLKKEALVLDVSQENKIKETIPNAINIPLNKLQINLGRLKELGKPIIVCCVDNIPSIKATKFLNLNNIDAINAGNRELLKSLVEQGPKKKAPVLLHKSLPMPLYKLINSDTKIL